MINSAITLGGEKNSIAFTLDRICRVCFGSGWRVWDPLSRLGFCFDIIALNPSLITRDDVLYKFFISICTIGKLCTDIDPAVFLIFNQPVRHKFGCNRMRAQIWSKSALNTWFFLNITFLCYFSNAQTTMERITFQTFCMFSSVFVVWSPSWTVIILNWSLALFNPLTPNGHYRGRTAPLTSKRCILYIYSTTISTEYFKHGIYSPLPSLQNAVCFIILTYLVPFSFTFYIQGVLKFKKK